MKYLKSIKEMVFKGLRRGRKNDSSCKKITGERRNFLPGHNWWWVRHIWNNYSSIPVVADPPPIVDDNYVLLPTGDSNSPNIPAVNNSIRMSSAKGNLDVPAEGTARNAPRSKKRYKLPA